MEKEDIFEEIIDMDKSHRKLNYTELDDIASEYSTDAMEELIDLQYDTDIEVVDDQESDIITDILEEENSASGEEEYEKTEDIVQAYFHSMGNISLLTRDEEIKELSKRLEEGKEIIRGIVAALPIYKKLESNLDKKDEENLDNSEEADETLEKSLNALDNLMFKIEIADRKVARNTGL